jgi:pimeloyl-ACP methyl ester carboxylesterase
MTFDDALRAELDAQPKLQFTESGSGPPLVLLHGFAQNAYAWRLVAAELADRFRVLRVDLKGHGQSVSADRTGYSIYHQALAVCAMIERAGLKDIVIAGHSFGGGVALAAALLMQQRMPGRLRALISVDGMSYEQRPPIGIEILRWPLVPTLAYPFLISEYFVRKGMTYAYWKPESLTPDAVREYARPMRNRLIRHGIVQAAREIRPADGTGFVARYPGIKVPTLILWGTHDIVVPPRFGDRLHAEIANSKLIKYDCGHCPAEERPHDVARDIAAFIETL